MPVSCDDEDDIKVDVVAVVWQPVNNTAKSVLNSFIFILVNTDSVVWVEVNLTEWRQEKMGGYS